ncbi:uncharacterized protein [Dysidea avara]|uniref:uncharacterized protein n=1 Tax=Dysidea avara TaxID=196820 RepID=UPI00332588CC
MSAWLIFVSYVVLLSINTSSAFVIVRQNTDNDMDAICTTTSPCTDLQPALPEMRSGSTLVISAGTNYTLSYDDAMTMYGMESVSIVGDGSANTIITCDGDAGLAFINVHNITIANLTLVGCGAWRNSTTRNGTYNHTLIFQCGIYFLDCSDVTMYDIILRDGPGTGVMMYDTIGIVTITNSHFLNNKVPSSKVEEFPGGGGVYIEFSYCKPDTTDFTACDPAVVANAHYSIHNCTFVENIGTSIRQKTTNYIAPIGSIHQQFGRGGAVSIYHKGNATNNTIMITDSLMLNNRAVWGGGICNDVLDAAQNNSVILRNVTFRGNSCPLAAGTGGGGIRIHFFPQVSMPRDVFTISNSIFDSNSAYYGGGISVSMNREKGVFVATNGITLENCTWVNNVARVGSAVDLSSSFDISEGQLAIPLLSNCNFTSNSNSYTNNVVQPLGLGAVHSNAVSITFTGRNYFIKNDGTALAVTDGVIDFIKQASGIFLDNHGLRGGAMALLGSTVLRVYPKTTLLFERNEATDRGGAIYSLSVGVRDVLNSFKCFIRYHNYVLAPQHWQTNFTFINNTSPNPGHAIYCTTLIPCSWGDSSFVLTPEVINETFRWNNVFTYSNDDEDTIATDPANANLITNTLSFSPGQLYNLNVSITDDVGVSRRTVLFVHSANDSVANVADTSTFVSDNLVEVHGSPGQQFQLDFQTITTRVLSFSLNTTLSRCPPGFYFPRNTDSSSNECKCSIYDSKQKYNDIPFCDEKALQAFLQPHFWAGYIDNDVLVTASCPAGYCYTKGNNRIPLPTEANKQKLDELICSPKNREGILCGHCKPGYYVYANSKDYECGLCTLESGMVIQFFVKFVPLFIFLLTIILMDINLAAGQLNAFVFFSQMLHTLNIHAGGQITVSDAAKPFVEFYQFCYGVFNLQYIESLDSFPSVCTFKYESALTSIILDYVTALCPVIVIFIVWFIMYTSDYCVFMGQRNILGKVAFRVRQFYRRVKPNKKISLSQSFFRGLVTFLVLSYTKFTLVTLSILTPAYLSGPGGKSYGLVVNLDGTLEYFGTKHLAYALPAVIVLVLFVLLPLAVMAMYPRACNALGLRIHKMMPFFDALHGSFKHDRHYFALLYFIYRLILVAIFTFTPEVQQQYVLQQVICIAIVMLHVTMKPYKKNFHNVIDVCLLALIPAVISISSFQLFNVNNFNGVNQFAMVIQIILLYLPLLYLGLVVSYKIYQRKKGCNGMEVLMGSQPHSRSYEDMPARVLNSMSYSEFSDGSFQEEYQVYEDQKKIDDKL